MRQPSFTLRAVLAAALCAGSAAAVAQDLGDRAVPPGVAQKQKAELSKGDPARWYRGDNTDQARLRILKKEIAAAYTQAKTACRQASSSERGSCLKQARDIYQHDMANAPSLLAQAPASEVTERVTTEVTLPAAAGSGAGQYGGSQSGATQAGGAQSGTATGAGAMQDDQSGAAQSGATQSGASQSGASQSGTSQSGAPQSGTSNSDTPQSDVPRR
ncbi:MAG: hypothetical protein ACJ8LG_07010 [Massilia sp.]